MAKLYLIQNHEKSTDDEYMKDFSLQVSFQIQTNTTRQIFIFFIIVAVSLGNDRLYSSYDYRDYI